MRQANANNSFTVVDEIVAKVNGDIITKTELEKSLHDASAALQQQGYKGEQLEMAYEAGQKDLLRNQIDQLLLVQRAKDMDIKVDPEVSKYMADLQRRRN